MNKFTPKETIRRGLLNFPSLYQEPADVLHHLFAVIGNGFEWFDGNLVSWYSEEKDADVWLQEQIDDAVNSNMPSLVLHYRQMQHSYQFIKDNIEDIIEHGDTRYAGDYYPLSSYSRIMTVPDDVTDEWLKAAYQFASDALTAYRMKAMGSKTVEENPEFIKYQELATKYDNMLIARGIHSTHEERAKLIDELMEEMVKELK